MPHDDSLSLRIRVNGTEQTIESGSTIAALLQKLKLDPKFLAIECNRELVPRTQHATTKLSDGDELEIVTLVGGG